MFWNAINACKDKPEHASLPARTPSRPIWSTMKFTIRPQSVSTPSKSSRKQPPIAGLLDRPNTAPALLTGDGLLVQNSHEDEFLQHIEDQEVRHVITNQRREQLTKKVLVAGYDSPAVPDLYNLQIHHNSGIRAMDEKRTKRSHSDASSPTAHCDMASDQLHELTRTLDGNMRHHYYRLGVPRPAPLGTGAKARRPPSGDLGAARRNSMMIEQLIDKDALHFRQELGGLFRLSQPQPRKSTTQQVSTKETPIAGAQASLTRSSSRRKALVRQNTVKDMPSLSRLAILLEQKFGKLRLAFKAFAKTDGKLSMGDWETALNDLSPDDDPGDLFRYLEKEMEECLTLAEFEEVFHTQKHAVPQSQLG